ncbi:MAG: Gfo/Idh/MocA family oxidoreductase [Novosphingobium sp.]|nr:Gfo/Idh/MocA family oxidoreductase [Novosphingobium sp.]
MSVTTTPIRVGIVGANPDRGWGSGVHRRVVQMLPGFELTAVCTTRAESAQSAAREFGAAHAFTDAADLAAHPDVDLVAICVLAPHHYGIAKAALEAGKHVYCEWPLALTVEQADELAALAAERGVKAMIGLHLNGAPALRHAARLVAGGFVGEMQDVNLHIRVPGSITQTMATRASGTHLLSIYGGHLLGAVTSHFSELADWTARAAIHLPPVDETGQPCTRDAPDHVLVQGGLANGALFTLDLCSMSFAGMGSCWRIGGSEGMIELRSAEWDMPAMEALEVHGARMFEPMQPLPIPAELDCAAIPSKPGRYSAYPGTEASRAALAAIGNLYGELGKAIREDAPVFPDFSHAAAIQRLVSSIDKTLIAASR